MLKRRLNNLTVIFIIFCSTSFYNFTILGPLQKIADIAGVGTILILILIQLVYSHETSNQRNFNWPVSLIIFASFTSMFAANLFHDQGFGHTLFAQRSLYFYLFYFLLHQLKVQVRDLEKIFIVMGLLYIALYLAQYFLYPKIIFDAFIRETRGTIRIYMPGAVYLTAAFFISLQNFMRTNRFKYLVLLLGIFSIIIMNGGRQSMAIMALMVVLFLVFDRKVKSKIFLGMLGMIGAFAIFLIFQDIFKALIMQSRSDANLGEEYVRIQAAQYYLTEFYRNPLAYITGHGAYYAGTNYGKVIEHNILYHQYYLGDIGLIGNYVIFGSFFILGVLTICFRSLRLRIEEQYTYIKYIYLAIIISLLTSGVFAQGDYIVFFGCLMYIVDVSRSKIKEEDQPQKKVLNIKNV